MFKNAYDAIASVFDSNVFPPSLIPVDYQGSIIIQILLTKLNDVDCLTIQVRDNGLGTISAKTDQKRIKAQERPFYFGSSGIGVTEILNNQFQSVGGQYSLTLSRGELFDGSQWTEATIHIPLKQFRTSDEMGSYSRIKHKLAFDLKTEALKLYVT